LEHRCRAPIAEVGTIYLRRYIARKLIAKEFVLERFVPCFKD
jgi:hypothetical protein